MVKGPCRSLEVPWDHSRGLGTLRPEPCRGLVLWGVIEASLRRYWGIIEATLRRCWGVIEALLRCYWGAVRRHWGVVRRHWGVVGVDVCLDVLFLLLFWCFADCFNVLFLVYSFNVLFLLFVLMFCCLL